MYVCIYIYIHIYIVVFPRGEVSAKGSPHPSAVYHSFPVRAFRARHVRTNGIGGEVRHGVTSGV